MKALSRRGLILGAIFLASCGGSNTKDGPPLRDVDVSKIPDAVPRVEPVTRAGNKNPYIQFDKKYWILPTSKGYKAKGKASWYGSKFHGRKTANGETYDMYAMTAAHKTLPIPSYVQVTNLANDRQVIVRINDRGPFYGGRIIDLSYAAAKKLGYSNQGTATVSVVGIDPVTFHGTKTVKISKGDNRYLQAGAFMSRSKAVDNRKYLQMRTGYPAVVRKDGRRGSVLFKVLVGPFNDDSEMANVRALLLRTEKVSSFVVYE